MLVVSGLLFFGGIVSLFPKKLAEKTEGKTKYIIGAVAEIVLGACGFVLMALAFLLHNPIAQVIFTWAFRVLLASMAALSIIRIIRSAMGLPRKGNQARGSARPAGPKMTSVGNVKIICGISTPAVFDGSEYRPAYETLVQEEELPFMTCELRTAQGDRYIGDLMFEPSESLAFKTDLRNVPISEVHLEHR